MRLLHTLILVSLLVFVLALVGGLALVSVRALWLWRAFRAFRRRLDAELGVTGARIALTERRLTGAGAQAEQLDAARVRLQRSLGRAFVLARAGGEASALLGRVRAAFPGK